MPRQRTRAVLPWPDVIVGLPPEEPEPEPAESLGDMALSLDPAPPTMRHCAGKCGTWVNPPALMCCGCRRDPLPEEEPTE